MLFIGNHLKYLRKQHGYTQEYIANHLHISRQAVSGWETNKNYPDLENVLELSKLYNISIDNLLNKGSDTCPKKINVVTLITLFTTFLIPFGDIIAILILLLSKWNVNQKNLIRLLIKIFSLFIFLKILLLIYLFIFK